MKGTSFFLLAALLSFIAVTHCDEVTVIDGFVELRQSDLTDDQRETIFAKLELELLTTEGVSKEKIPCSPNGYYVVPVYETGDFVLKLNSPEEWQFEPSQVAVTISAGTVSDIDRNFYFKGFQISGLVQSAGSKQGPDGVMIRLFGADTKTDAKTATTENGGVYTFDKVLPGKYTAQVADPTLSRAAGKSQANIVVGWTQTTVSDIVIQGYQLAGKITAKSGAASGVRVFLYSKKSVTVDCASVADIKDAPSTTEKANLLCATTTDSNGNYVFDKVPYGSYILTASYHQESISFDISPAQINTSVAHGNAQVATAFEVTGFSVAGKVVNKDGKGVSGVAVLLNGEVKGTSDSTGAYVLSKVSSGSYKLEGRRQHETINAIQNVQIQPSLQALPDLEVTAYDICGAVSIDKTKTASSFAISNRQITLLSSQTKKTTTTKTDSEGNYCLTAQPGSYTVSAIVTDQERQSGLHLAPNERAVTIGTKPILDVNFTQSRVKISGSVQCAIKDCDLDGTEVVLSAVSRHSEDVTVDVANGAFKFEDVIPGSYDVKISHPKWCWDQESIRVDAFSNDVEGVTFKQAGYAFEYQTSHDVTVKYTLKSTSSGSQTGELNLTRAGKTLCLPQPGSYEFVPQSCITFDAQSYSFDTSNPQPLKLNAQEFQLSGKVAIKKPKKETTRFTLESYAKVDIVETNYLGTDDESAEEKLSADLKYDSFDEKTSLYTYTYSITHKPLYEFEVSVVRTNEAKTRQLLFNPTSQTVSINNACTTAETIKIVRGSLPKGSISPALKGVSISVSEEGSTEVLATAITGDDGSYEIGPLYPGKKYTYQASLEGYRFEQVADKLGSFKSVQLSTLNVNISDSKTKAPLGDVFLSLSNSQTGFKQNVHTNTAGQHKFIDLVTGEYFLVPLLKEYVFDPASVKVEIEDGKQITKNISAKRVAFSAYGSVTKVNSDIIEGLVVRATPKNGGSVAESSTDYKGEFRIRGLKPNTDYEITAVGLGSSRPAALTWTTPAKTTVSVKEDDVKNISFTVFAQESLFNFSGVVVLDSEAESSVDYNNDLKALVTLQKETENGSTNKSQKISKSRYFHFTGLEAGNYSLQVTRQTLGTPGAASPLTYEVVVGGQKGVSFKQVVLPSRSSDSFGEISAASLYGLLFVIAAMVLVYNYAKGAPGSGAISTSNKDASKGKRRN